MPCHARDDPPTYRPTVPELDPVLAVDELELVVEVAHLVHCLLILALVTALDLHRAGQGKAGQGRAVQ